MEKQAFNISPAQLVAYAHTLSHSDTKVMTSYFSGSHALLSTPIRGWIHFLESTRHILNFQQSIIISAFVSVIINPSTCPHGQSAKTEQSSRQIPKASVK